MQLLPQALPFLQTLQQAKPVAANADEEQGATVAGPMASVRAARRKAAAFMGAMLRRRRAARVLSHIRSE